MNPYEATESECFAHPLWDKFAQHMIARGIWKPHWVWVEASWWRTHWDFFLAGVEAENTRMVEAT